jgi:hypothetical protein
MANTPRRRIHFTYFLICGCCLELTTWVPTISATSPLAWATFALPPVFTGTTMLNKNVKIYSLKHIIFM